jgi:hypothetical protein
MEGLINSPGDEMFIDTTQKTVKRLVFESFDKIYRFSAKDKNYNLVGVGELKPGDVIFTRSGKELEAPSSKWRLMSEVRWTDSCRQWPPYAFVEAHDEQPLPLPESFSYVPEGF